MEENAVLTLPQIPEVFQCPSCHWPDWGLSSSRGMPALLPPPPPLDPLFDYALKWPDQFINCECGKHKAESLFLPRVACDIW